MAAGDNGLWVSRPDGTSEVLYPHTRQLPYVKDNVLALYESPHDRALWMGGRQGISVLLPDGRGVALDVKTDSVDLTGYVMVNHIAGDRAGRIWVSPANRGIIRIEGDPAFPQRLRLRRYGPSSAAVTACYEDSRRCLWALSSSGLLRYDAGADCFRPAGRPGLLVGRKVQALGEDRRGALWLATDRALLRLGADSSLVSFTAQDGLASASFVPNAAFRLGDSLYFGTAEGFVAFEPEGSYGGLRPFVPNLVVTDFLLDGTSYFALDSSARSALAAEWPMLARQITVPASARSFGVEFSLLAYADLAETRYACLLEGYDEEWRAVDGAVRRAVYERVPPGDYRFRLRAVDSRGQWHGLPYAIGCASLRRGMRPVGPTLYILSCFSSSGGLCGAICGCGARCGPAAAFRPSCRARSSVPRQASGQSLLPKQDGAGRRRQGSSAMRSLWPGPPAWSATIWTTRPTTATAWRPTWG